MLFRPRNHGAVPDRPGSRRPPDGTLPVAITPATGVPLEGTGRELTIRGLQVEVPEAVAGEVGFQFQGLVGPLQGRATVVRCTASGDGRHLLDLEFAPGMSAAEMEQLARFLASRSSRG